MKIKKNDMIISEVHYFCFSYVEFHWFFGPPIKSRDHYCMLAPQVSWSGTGGIGKNVPAHYAQGALCKII
jgi:hypothetical protein